MAHAQSLPPTDTQSGLPFFERVSHGYSMHQVDDYIRQALARLHQQEQDLLGHAEQLATAAVHSPQAEQMIDELMKLALDEILGQKAAAITEAEQFLSSARQEAEQIIAAARDESESMVSGAREQSGSLLADARSSARKMLDDAASRVDEAEQHIAALARTHEETLSRLDEISRVTTRLLGSERERGLPGSVSGAVQANAPAQLLAAPE